MTKNPSIGFVSLGCPKALVDSERIVTHLRAVTKSRHPWATTSHSKRRPRLRRFWNAVTNVALRG